MFDTPALDYKKIALKSLATTGDHDCYVHVKETISVFCPNEN